jgi:hypothetical protein
MKNNKKTIVVSITLMLLLCSILVSSVKAADDNQTITSTDQTPIASQEPALTSTEEPNLIATENGTTTNDNSQLYEQRDNSTAQATDTSGSESNNMLLSAQTAPDYTVYIVAAAALVAVIALSLVFIFVKKRK